MKGTNLGGIAASALLVSLAACGGATPRAASPTIAAQPGVDARVPQAAHCVFHSYTPPACGTNAFRRFYTSPGAGYIFSAWVPTSNTTTMPTPLPTSSPPPVSATGLLFVEGWPTSKLNGPATEAGFIYDPANNWYRAFEKAAGERYWYSATHFAVAQLSVALYAGATCPNPATTCAVASFSGTCYGATTACSATHSASTAGWIAQACCVLASMVSIAEPAPGRNWKSGALFGPVDQADCAAAAQSAAGCTSPGLMFAGQRYPNSPSRIVVREQIPGLPGTEIDTIDLHP